MNPQPLTQIEQSVLWCLAVGAMAERTASSAEAAEEMLERYATIDIDGDAHDLELYVGGELLIRAPRSWMATIGGDDVAVR